MENNKGLATKESASEQSAEMLISRAIDKNVSVETMEKLLAMRRELKAEKARELYIKAMAKFQSECPIITKSSNAGTGNFTYKYASLEHIVNQVKDILYKNGFSYTFDTRKTQNSLTTFCHVKHIDGHNETSQFEIAIDTTARMNISQKDGSASSYGKRYAFCNAFGILTGDEDNDAAPIPTSTPSSAKKPVESPKNGYVDAEIVNSQVPDNLESTPANKANTFKNNHYCDMHRKAMKDRGRGIWDHRAKLNARLERDDAGSWYHCQGQGWHISPIQK